MFNELRWTERHSQMASVDKEGDAFLEVASVTNEYSVRTNWICVFKAKLWLVALMSSRSYNANHWAKNSICCVMGQSKTSVGIWN